MKSFKNMAGVPTDWQLGCVEVKQRGEYLLKSGQWSDCTFLVGAEPDQVVIAGHKLILAMASPVFEAMFYGGMAESNDPIPILDVQPEAFRALLEYIYTDNINISSSDIVCEMYYGAKKYMLPHLVKECTRYMWSKLKPRNACCAYELARLFENNALMNKCLQIISKNTKEVLTNSSFEDVELNTVITVFSLDYLNVDSELDLFEAAVRYAKAQDKRTSERSVTPQSKNGPPNEMSKSPGSSTSKDKKANVEGSAQNSPEAVLDTHQASDSCEQHSPAPSAGGNNKPDLKSDKPTIRSAIEKIRFLSLTPQQFAEGPAKSSLLTESEIFAVLKNIASTSSEVAMPSGFSTRSVSRGRARFQQKQTQEREMKIASLYEAQQARALDRVRHSPSYVGHASPLLPPTEHQQDKDFYKKFMGILNKLTPQKFDTLLDRVKTLDINNQKRLEGVVDLIFEKAIDDPNHNPNLSGACAALCNKLSVLKVQQVPVDNPTSPRNCVNFRALIINKCQYQFETPKVDEQILNYESELAACTDPTRKKELTLMIVERTRLGRMRSVGTARFIGELYKLKMLTSKIMDYCMKYLVIEKVEDEKLECLCMLLTTIGEQVENEVHGQLDNIFKEMQDIVDRKPKNISSRVRFMLQDVIDLRKRKWVAKTMKKDQIQKEAMQRSFELMNASRMGGFRRDDNRRQNSNNSFIDNTWKSSRVKSYPVDTLKLKAVTQKLFPCSSNPAASGSSIRSGSVRVARSHYSTPSTSAAPAPARRPAPVPQEPLSEPKKKSIKYMIDLYIINSDYVEMVAEVKQLYTAQHHAAVVNEMLNIAVEKSAKEIALISKALLSLVASNTISPDILVAGIKEMLQFAPDLYTDIPMFYDNLGMIIAPQIENKHITFAQIFMISESIIACGHGHLFLKAVIRDLKGSMGPSFVKSKWQESGLHIKQWMDEKLVKTWLEDNKFEFLEGDSKVSEDTKEILTPAQTQSKLLQLMNADETRECIKGWIQDKLGNSTNEDWFIRTLIQAICEQALFGPYGRDVPHFNQDRMYRYASLIHDFGETTQSREASCLFGIQELIRRLGHPQDLTVKIFQYLHEHYVILSDGFIAWEKSEKEPEGKGEMMKALRSFFTSIKEADLAARSED